MKNSIYLLVAVFTFSFLSVKAQFSSTPCDAGALPVSCASNTVNLTSAFTNSGVINPSVENGVGCNSVGSNMTAGRIGNISGDNAYDGWFTTTADDLGVVDVYASIVTGDPVVGIYSGTCDALTLLTCDDDGGTGLDANATATGLTPGQTYWVRVWDYNGGTGTYSITSNDGTPPANDLCSAAESLTLNAVPISGTTYCATVSVGDYNDCENLTENNVWYSFTTTVQGEITVNFSSIDCFGSGQGIDVSVFYGDCSSAVSYGCTAVNAGNTGSISTFTGPAGTYFVMVDGNNSGGTTALCEFDVDVDFVGCTADAGTNTSPALITVCAGDTYNPTATGTTNTNAGSDPCIGWGFWVANDPLNQYPGMTGVGDLPTGNNPAGAGGDPNYVGVYTSATHPLANGETPTLPAEGNGVTYYLAPITLSNCATGGITTSCFDIGNVTQVYHNPQINTSYVIDCDDSSEPSTYVAIVASGGNPRVDGSNFTVTNLGDGTLDISGGTGNGVTFYVNDVPDGGSVSVLIEDDSGCSETLILGPIDATAYCPVCGAEAGNIEAVQTGSGVTVANNGVNGSPFVLCYGDDLTLTHLGDYVLPPDPNYCGSIPLPGSAGSCNPGIVYGIFTSLAATANPFDDAAFTNWGYMGEDRYFSNNGTLINSLIDDGIPIVNNTIWLYPVTADITGVDMNGDGRLNWASDHDGDGCVDSGFPFQITFLNSLAGTILYTCNGPEVTITGGYPEFFGGNYLITNNGGGTITGLPVTHNGSITITGLNDGDAYDFDITDNNGCSINIAGTFNYSEPVLSINNLASEFCLNDPADDFDVTPLPFTITTGSFDIDFVSDGFTSELTWSLVDNLGNPIATGGPYGGFPSGVSLPTVVVSGLDPAVGPFTLVLNDSFGDGQDGTSSGGGIGSTTVTNNITGQVVASTSGNWGATTSLSLGNFFSTSVSIVGTGVVDNGDGTAVFTPSTVGTHTINFIYDNGEGCTYTESQIVTVHRNPLLSSVINPVICSDETILLSDYSPGEANGVAGTGTWYEGANSSGATAPVIAFTPADGDQFFYEYVATNGGCIDSKMITVTVNATPVITALSNQVVCDSYELPSITGSNLTGNEAYYTSPNGGGTTYAATDVISFDQFAVYPLTLYIYDETGTTPNCFDEETFELTIHATPVITALSNQEECDSYELPSITGSNLTGNRAYYTLPNGGGTTYAATDVISFDPFAVYPLTLYIYDETGTTPNCFDEETFELTIHATPVITALSNQVVCDSYELPAITGSNLTGNEAYYTSPNGGGTTYAATDVISFDPFAVYPLTLYIYDETGTTPNCFDEETFELTIHATPVITALSNQVVCDSYELPSITGSNLTGNEAYYTSPNGGGTTYAATDVISFDQFAVYPLTLYIYDETGTTPNCFDEEIFELTIHATPVITALSNQVVCDSYELPSITGSNLTGNEAYYTSPNGGGTTYAATDVISFDPFAVYPLTLYIYDETGTTPNCFDEETFELTIHATPVITALSNQVVCDSYELPAIVGSTLTGNEAYYTSPNGGGTTYAATDVISFDPLAVYPLTLYIYDETGTTPNCFDEETFELTIHATPVITALSNQVVCDSYELPLIVGSNLTGNEAYYTSPNGGGITYTSTDVISFDPLAVYPLTLYIYDETGTTPNCFDEETFELTINATPVITSLANQEECDSYILPIITGSNLTGNEAYYTSPNGGGLTYDTGDVLNFADFGSYPVTLYIYDETGTIPNCSDEETFELTLIESPTYTLSPTDPLECDGSDGSILIEGLNLGFSYSYTYTDGAVTVGPIVDVSNGSGELLIENLEAGAYTVTLSVVGDSETCSGPSLQTTLNNPGAPIIDSYMPIHSCDSYILPEITGLNLTGNEAYYSQIDGNGDVYSDGDLVAESITLYAFDENGVCSDQKVLVITIHNTPVITSLSNQVVCDSYELPAITGSNLTGNEAYYTSPNGGGITYAATDVISFDPFAVYPLTLYIYDETGTTPNCFDEETFELTIHATPVITSLSNQEECDSYELPSITGSNLTGNEAYYTLPNGGGATYAATDVISFDPLAVYPLTLYIYDETGTTPNCFDEETFELTINATPVITALSNQVVCDSYELPAITGSNLTGNEAYYTSPNGGGITYAATDVISFDPFAVYPLTLYIYDETGTTPNCFDEETFELTINATPVITSLANQEECDSYTLPLITGLNLTGNEAYYTSPNGGGITFDTGDVLNFADFGSYPVTLYIYDETGTIPNCSDDETFELTINLTTIFTVDSSTGPTSCGADDGTITISGLTPNTNYNLSYTNIGDGLVNLTNILTDDLGVYVITDLAPDVYNNFTINDGNCDYVVINPIALSDPGAPSYNVVVDSHPSTCGGNDGAIFITGLLPNTSYELSYLFNNNSVPTQNVTTDPDGDYMIINLFAGEYTVFRISISGCAGTTVDGPFILVDPDAPDAPDVIVTAPTCSADGSAEINGYDSGLTYTFDPIVPTEPTVDVSGSILNVIFETAYTVTAFDGTTLCTSATSEFTVFAELITPVLNINTPADVCSPSTVDLTDVAVTVGSTNISTLTYWEDASATIPYTTETAATAGTYYIQAENSGCYDIAPVTVTVNTTPVLNINTPADVCSPSTVDLTDVAVTVGSTNISTLTYWEDASATIPYTTETAVTAGTYYIQAENSGCYDIAPVTVTVNTTPVLNINTPADVCSPSTVDLTDVAVTVGSTNISTLTYWEDASATIPYTTETAATAGTYYIQAENSGCYDIAPVTVTVNTIPVLNINTPADVCSPSTVDLTDVAVTVGSTNISTLTYWEDASATIPYTTETAVTAGTYYIQAENSGCYDIAPVTVTVNTTPVLNINTPADVCSPSTVDLTDVAVTVGSTNISTLTYWEDASATIPYTTETAATAGTYYIQAENSGCYDIAPVTVTVNTIPVIAPFTSQSICDSYTLPMISGTDLTNNEAYYTLANGNGDVYTEGDVISSTITLYAYDINGTCSSEEELVITIDATPSITNPGNQVSCASFDLDALAITGTDLSSNVAYYNNSQMNSGTALTGTLTETQTVWIYDANGSCTDELSFEITVHANPSIRAFYGGDTYCEGEFVNDVMVEFEGTPDFTINYRVNGVATSITTSEEILSLGNAEGVYTLTELVDANCSADVNDEEIILINPIPDAPTAGNDATYCHYEVKLPLFAETSLNGELTWYSDEELSQQIGTGDSFTPFSTVGVTSYYVMETAEGCKGLATLINIVVEKCDIEIPTAFTPNGDGINDVWEIPNLSENFPDCVVRIFNRWGNLLFESTGYHNPWDGTYNGEPMPVASYYYIIDFNDGNNETASGSLTIVRRK
jgi:gliding motility-associated-like protein